MGNNTVVIVILNFFSARTLYNFIRFSHTPDLQWSAEVSKIGIIGNNPNAYLISVLNACMHK